MIAKKRKIKKSGNFKKVFFTFLIGFILLGGIGFLVISNLKIGKKRAELTSKIEEITKEIQLLEERNKQLEAGILQAESEGYWEARLYEQGYKKPGEEAIVIIPPEGFGEEKEEKEEKTFSENFLKKIKDLTEKIGL